MASRTFGDPWLLVDIDLNRHGGGGGGGDFDGKRPGFDIAADSTSKRNRATDALLAGLEGEDTTAKDGGGGAQAAGGVHEEQRRDSAIRFPLRVAYWHKTSRYTARGLRV